MDLIGLMLTDSIWGKKFALECRCAVVAIVELIIQLHTEKEAKLKNIRSDHGQEFENSELTDFGPKHGINHQFSAPITPLQNGVAERKNKILHGITRVMIHAMNIPHKFWAEWVQPVTSSIRLHLDLEWRKLVIKSGIETLCIMLSYIWEPLRHPTR